MSHDIFQAEPKPFALVPVPDEVPKRHKAVTHKRFQGLTGRLELEIIVESEYFFIGSGGYDFDPNAKGDRPDVWHTFYRRNGQLCIPATSLKGAVRSIVEAISNSCVSQIRKNEYINREHKACGKEDALCPACRLFGTAGLRGRVYFSDAVPPKSPSLTKLKIAELWEPRRAIEARRFYETKRFQHASSQRPERNHRFVEAVSRGTCFQGELIFENLNEDEFGLILYALGLSPYNESWSYAFKPKLGGAKPRCLGAVKFEPKRARLLNTDSIRGLLAPQLLERERLQEFLVRCLQACQRSDLLYLESWQTLVNALQPQDEPCPRGNY